MSFVGPLLRFGVVVFATLVFGVVTGEPEICFVVGAAALVASFLWGLPGSKYDI